MQLGQSGRAWVVAFVLGFTWSFVGCERPCGPMTCPTGCCSSDGVCSTGTEQVECGERGAACARCGQGERCTDHQCLVAPVVDAGMDAGRVVCACSTSCCLPDGTCAPNTDPAACGPAGLFCGQCAAGQRCQLGVCQSAACAGCIDPFGLCRSGTNLTACGGDGGVCLACAPDQACREGQCVFTRCDQTNCRFGCCRPDLSCETNISVSACGVSGVGCMTCASTESCVAGVCL